MVYVPGEQIAPEETIEVYYQILKKSKEKKKKKMLFHCNMDLHWVAPTMRKFVSRLGIKVIVALLLLVNLRLASHQIGSCHWYYWGFTAVVGTD